MLSQHLPHQLPNREVIFFSRSLKTCLSPLWVVATASTIPWSREISFFQTYRNMINNMTSIVMIPPDYQLRDFKDDNIEFDSPVDRWRLHKG
jgi:hypothetical protein